MVRCRACNENNYNSKIIIFNQTILYRKRVIRYKIILFQSKSNIYYILRILFFKRSVNLVLTLILMEIPLPRLIKSSVLMKYIGARIA